MQRWLRRETEGTVTLDGVVQPVMRDGVQFGATDGVVQRCGATGDEGWCGATVWCNG